ncbi:acyclic terpene utilization AtuA family protein [Kineobactrum salinum]|uniref:DUF1446 domain-containing protein n=1 Tax=Kineobactrum salinum TaxID=2708301 RepID=A0A6C0U4N0_9GAMM|nr:acyclic terpene utilization AtuA family protein [Kineobactrum salinum]QIB66888.1 DUF1446 domain-containing protein [Kineobactrum salinum]
MTAHQTVRIGCASAFYGDSQLAARQLVDRGDIDYLVFDYLAEVTMAILAKAQAKDHRLGFAMDFVTVAMKDVIADCARKGIKVIANAGGVNVPGCIAALEELCSSLSLDLRIAGIYGDDLAGREEELATLGLPELQSGAPLPRKLASINAYLGARPIVRALEADAQIIVTGRVVDSAVVIAPLMHEFGWAREDYDQLAQAALAGHVIECGAQCTGGNFTDWHQVPDFSNMSYPIVEVSEDASFIVQIPPKTGGMVTPGTVGEQLLYEIGDPANYLLPDVACDWTGVKFETVGKDQLRVSGARGRAPGPQYKVCAIHADGFKLSGNFFMAGPRCAEKARASLEAWVKRTRRYFAEQGWPDYRGVSLEIIGAEDTYGPHSRARETREVMGKFGLHHDNPAALTFASHERAYLATSGPPGMSGFALERVRPTPLMRVHSSLIDKSAVPVTIQLGSEIIEQRCFDGDESSAPATGTRYPGSPVPVTKDAIHVPLEALAWARSGDKGDNANIGVMSRKPEFVPYLREQLTAESVRNYFAHTVRGEVTRFELPGILAFNFFITEALGGGGTASLLVDPQGKALAQMLLSKTITVPAKLLE